MQHNGSGSRLWLHVDGTYIEEAIIRDLIIGVRIRDYFLHIKYLSLQS